MVLPGRPHVWLEVGGAVRRAEYSGPVGSATRALEFSYTVQEGDLDTDGVRLCSSDRPGIDCGRIHLNGGTIRAARGGLDAELGTPNQSAQAGHKVDAVIVAGHPGAPSDGLLRPRSGYARRTGRSSRPGVERRATSFRLIFITSSERGARQTRRPASTPTTSSCRGGRMPGISAIQAYLWRRLPRAVGQHRGPCNARDERLRHRCGHRRSRSTG